MKRFYSFFVATLLLSTTLWANNVAKVGTTDYTDIASAIAAWTTDGGTLQLSDNCDYTATATATIAKASTLDLNGKTLTWNVDGSDGSDGSKISAITISGGSLTIKDDTKAGKLSFLLTNMSGLPTNGIVYADSKGTAESFTIENATLAFDVQAASTYKPNGMNAKVIHIKKGNVSISNSTLLTKNNAAYALYLDCASASVRLEKFDNNTIRYEGCTATKLLASQVEGVHIAKIDADNDVVFNNCTIDMSNVPVQYDKYSNKKWSTYATTIYGLNIAGGTNNKSNVTIVGGEYKAPTNSTSANVRAVTQGTNMTITINSGKFEGKNSVKTATGGIEGGSFIPCPSSQYAKSGYHFTKQSDGYYVLEAGEPLFTINEEGFTDVNELKKYTDGKATVMLFTTNTFTIPAEANIRLSVKDVNTAYTIVNNGTVLVNNEFSGKFTNNGTLNISEACPNGEFTNNGTAAIYSDGTTCKSLTNSGTLNIGGTPHSAGDFTASTLVNTGTLTVSAGTYTAQQYNSLIKDNIATGYRGWALDATKQKYVVNTLTAYYFEVDGVKYTNITDALKVCTEATPVILWKDYSKGCTISDGKDSYINLNGKTWTIPATKNNLVLTHGGLTVSGTGKIVCLSHYSISLTGHATEPNYTRLTIGEGVTLTNDKYVNKYILMLQNAPCGGIVVNFNGKMDAKANNKWCHGFYVNGALSSTTNAPVLNIGEKAEITIEKGIGAYAAGYAKWNFAGKMVADTCGFELRAGEFTMTGGSIEATMTAPADDQFNGNGSTSQACAIAVCQHSTKLPVSVIIDGGSLKAYTPIYQANPQNNPQEAIDKVSVVVNDAQVFSTSKNIVWSANQKVTLNGGIYNLSPAAYVADGKVVVDNTDEATKATYPYAIGEKQTAVTFTTAGNWNTAANWSNNTIATAATPVVIAADVTIPSGVQAQALGITVNSGKVITIESGATLIVGNGGLSGITSAAQLLIKDGGALAISPAVETVKTQVPSTNEIKTTIREVKDDYAAGNATYKYIWKNIALPVTKASMDFSPKGTLTLNDWNNGWQAASEFGTPFKGYHITVHESVETTVKNPTYTFTGNLNGNTDVTLTMANRGYHLFGNSWSAPLDVYEILNQIEHYKNSEVQTGIKVYISDKCTLAGKTYFDGQYEDITRDGLKNAVFAKDFSTIGAHECFFLCSNVNNTQIALNYEKAVWNAVLASANTTASAPKRVVVASDENTGVKVVLTADNERWDAVRLYKNGTTSLAKIMNEGSANVNIYATTEQGNYSTLGTEDLLGIELTIRTNGRSNYTLSFDNVEGEIYAIQDLKTGAVIEMSAGNTYTFTADANTTSTRFRIVDRSEVTTGTDNVVATQATGIYTVMGQYLGETEIFETLPAGVYIVNGKKVVK